jgi:hypothetical protein
VQRVGGCRGQQQRAQGGHGDERVVHQRVRTGDVGVHIDRCGSHVHRRLMSKMPRCIGDSPLTRSVTYACDTCAMSCMSHHLVQAQVGRGRCHGVQRPVCSRSSTTASGV